MCYSLVATLNKRNNEKSGWYRSLVTRRSRARRKPVRVWNQAAWDPVRALRCGFHPLRPPSAHLGRSHPNAG